MSESTLESALARVADDLSLATEAIREEIANHGEHLAPNSCRSQGTQSASEQS